eukprot:jgi/Mesvir1/27294/Mv07127-RA.1
MACAVYLEAKEGTPPSEDIFCGQIRRTPDGRVAAADIVKCIIYLREDGTYAREALGNANLTLKRLSDKQCLAASNTNNMYTFPGRNQRPTRVMTEEEVYELIMLLPGARATAFRRNTSKLLKHYFHATEELISELLGRYEALHGRAYQPPPCAVAEEPRIKQCESVKAAAAEISNTPRAQVDGKVYAKVFGIQNKSIMNMTADEFRHVQNMKKGDLVRDMWTEEMNSGAFFMNCVFRAAVAGEANLNATMSMHHDRQRLVPGAPRRAISAAAISTKVANLYLNTAATGLTVVEHVVAVWLQIRRPPHELDCPEPDHLTATYNIADCRISFADAQPAAAAAG